QKMSFSQSSEAMQWALKRTQDMAKELDDNPYAFLNGAALKNFTTRMEQATYFLKELTAVMNTKLLYLKQRTPAAEQIQEIATQCPGLLHFLTKIDFSDPALADSVKQYGEALLLIVCREKEPTKLEEVGKFEIGKKIVLQVAKALPPDARLRSRDKYGFGAFDWACRKGLTDIVAELSTKIDKETLLHRG